jgi:hypothetical protein
MKKIPVRKLAMKKSTITNLDRAISSRLAGGFGATQYATCKTGRCICLPTMAATCSCATCATCGPTCDATCAGNTCFDSCNCPI